MGLHRSTTSALLVTLVLASMAGGASAQPAKPVVTTTTNDERAKATAKFEEASKLADVGDHEGARALFEDVWRVLKEPSVVYNLARSEQLAGRPTDALVHFRTFVSMPDPRITRAMRDRAWLNHDAVRKLVAYLLIDTDKGGKVWVDGVQTPVSLGTPAVVMPGSHRIRATVKGGQVVETTIEVVANGERSLNFRTTPCWTRPRPPLPKEQKFVYSVGEPCDDE